MNTTEIPRSAFPFYDPRFERPFAYIDYPLEDDGEIEDITQSVRGDEQNYVSKDLDPLIESDIVTVKSFSNLYSKEELEEFAVFFESNLDRGRNMFNLGDSIVRTTGEFQADEVADDLYLVEFDYLDLNRNIQDYELLQSLLTHLPELIIERKPSYTIDAPPRDQSEIDEDLLDIYLEDIDILEQCLAEADLPLNPPIELD